MKKNRMVKWKKLLAISLAAALLGSQGNVAVMGAETGNERFDAAAQEELEDVSIVPQVTGTDGVQVSCEQEHISAARTPRELVQISVHSRVGGADWKPNMDVSDTYMRSRIDFYVKYGGIANEMVGDEYEIQWISEDGTVLAGVPENAGTYTVKIVLHDSLAGVAELVDDTFVFTIRKLNLSSAILGLYGDGQPQWTGEPILPANPYVANSSYTLPEDNYELVFVEGKNCVEPGMAYVKAVAKGENVEGEKEFQYQIIKRRLDVAYLKEELTKSFVYDGTAKQPALTGNYENIASVEYLYFFDEFGIRLTETPKDAGNYSCGIRFVPEDTEHYSNSTFMQEFEITPRKLEADVQVQKRKVYDSWTNIESPVVTAENIVAGDEVRLSASAVYDNKQTGKNKTITVSYQMSGKDAGNYLTPDGFTLTDGEIVPKEVEAGNIVLQSYDYNGSREVPLDDTTVTDKNHWVLVGRYASDDVDMDLSEVRAFMEDADAGVDKPVTFTGFKLTGADSFNYRLAQPKASVTIRSIAFSNSFQVEMSDYQYGSSVPVPSLPRYLGDGEITFKYRSFGSEEEYREWKDIGAETLKPGAYEMIAQVKGTVNYEGGTTQDPQKFQVSRLVPELSGTKNFEKEYDDEPFYLDVTQKGDGALTYQVVEGEDVVSVATDGKVTIEKAGQARIRVCVKQTDYYEEGNMYVTIAVRKSPGRATVTQEDWVYSSDNSNMKLPVVVSQTNGIEQVTYRYKPKGAKDEAYVVQVPMNAGEYTVQAVFAETENYLQTTATADFVIRKKHHPDNMLIGDETNKNVPKHVHQVKEVSLPEGWLWKDAEAPLIPGGVLTAWAEYVDTMNYEQYQMQIQMSQEAEIVADATDNTYTIGEDDHVVVTCTGALSEWKGVYLDGVNVDAANYVLKEGSTILTFSKAYLDALAVGTHKIVLSYTAGDVETALTIKKKDSGANPPVNPPTENPPENPPTEHPPVNPPTEDPPVNPPTEDPPVNPPTEHPSGNNVQNTNRPVSGTAGVKTGDESILWIYVFLLLASIGMMTTIALRKRKND